MSSDAVVSLGSPGAGRSTSLQQVYDAGASVHTVRNRGGVLVDNQEQSSNLGFGAIQTNIRVLRGLSSAWKITGQAVQWKWRAWPVLVRPAVQFTHSTGLWVMEALLSWDANAAAGESGIMWGAGNMRQPRLNFLATHASFGVLNIGGVLTWISLRAAPLAREIVPLANGGALIGANAWNKVRIEIRSATAASDASVSVYVNNILSLVRAWNAANLYLPDLEAAAACFIPYVIQADASDLYFRDLTLFEGPDVPAL
jgi:hypothetical protein